MGRKLFVGGLAWATTDESLKKAFEKFGQLVSANVIMDRETGRSRGFGFVLFAEDQQAQLALDAMQGADIDGRRIRVDPATEGPGGGGPRREPRFGGGERPHREGPAYPSVERRGGGGGPAGGGDAPRREWSAPAPMEPPPPRWEGGEGEGGRDRATRRRTDKKRKETRGAEGEQDWPRTGKRFRKDDPSDWWEE